MSFAPYFRVKAELFGMLLAKSDNAVDRCWYGGLVRTSGAEVVPPDQNLELEGEIALLLQRYGVKAA